MFISCLICSLAPWISSLAPSSPLRNPAATSPASFVLLFLCCTASDSLRSYPTSFSLLYRFRELRCRTLGWMSATILDPISPCHDHSPLSLLASSPTMPSRRFCHSLFIALCFRLFPSSPHRSKNSVGKNCSIQVIFSNFFEYTLLFWVKLTALN
jgi:hypothetical protein